MNDSEDSQLSSLDPLSSPSPAVPATPASTTSHAVTAADIDLSKVRDSSMRVIRGLGWRVRHRSQAHGTKISWIFAHGGDCTHAIETHLAQIHRVQHPKKPRPTTTPADTPIGRAFARLQERSSPFALVTPFHDKRFQEAYINAVIKLDLTFRQASAPELREVILLGGPMAERYLPTSHKGVGNWE
ncbi:HAT domain-containing protein [Botryosphaeria dothidea]|uniref:HAT domain-containing protein n=1 Tax=Botryosphaeria dothidea TaxID=55169 RepID=A0A8H4NBQ2_9PEZI|nr:HAT domain-containing protein [Botryosphaeria dothidea]